MWELTSRAHNSLVFQVCGCRKHRWSMWIKILKRNLRLQFRRKIAQRRCSIQRLRNYWLVFLIKALLLFQPVLESFKWLRPAVFYFSAPIWIGRDILEIILLLWVRFDDHFSILRKLCCAHSLHRTCILYPSVDQRLFHAHLCLDKTLEVQWCHSDRIFPDVRLLQHWYGRGRPHSNMSVHEPAHFFAFHERAAITVLRWNSQSLNIRSH